MSVVRISQEVGLLLTHGQVLTMDAERRIFVDGAIAIDGDRIIAVGRTPDLLGQYKAKDTWDLKGALVRPGFVDGHTHVVDHLRRGLHHDTWPSACGAGERDIPWEDVALPYWESLTPGEEYLSALLAFMEMVRNGTTAFIGGGTLFDMPAVLRAADQVGLRGMLGEFIWNLRDKPQRLVRTTDECLERLQFQIDMYGLYGPNQRVGVGVIVLGMGTCSEDLIVRAKALADKHGTQMNMHQSWCKNERADYMENVAGDRLPLVHLADLGVLGPNLMLVHGILMDSVELDLLAENGTSVIHCPAASMTHGLGASHQGRFPEMLQRGITVALGSDSANWSNAFDMGLQIYLAATMHREAKMEMPTITAEQALEMATLNGARALGMEEHIGSLEPGRKADIVIIGREKRPEWHPGLDLVYDLVYAGQAKSVDTVLIDGQVVLRDGHFVEFDEEEAYVEIDRAAWAVAKRLGFPRYRWPVID